MDSPMLKNLKSKCPDKEFPSNLGMKWTFEEEKMLLEQLDENIDINIIAQRHNRTVGGIFGRQQAIAYKMYLKNVSMEEIMRKTKLNNEQVSNAITEKDTKKKHPKEINLTAIHEPTTTFSLENEVIKMRNEIQELKHTMKELVEMMKAVYEFEHE